MSKPSVKDHIAEMVRDVIWPEMKAAGFRRRGRVLWRDGPEVCHTAHVEMSTWGTREKGMFRTELGVFWHNVEALLDNPSTGKMPPPANRCTFQISLNVARPSHGTAFREVELSSDFAAIGRELLRDLLNEGLAWFAYRSDLRQVLEWERYRVALGKGLYGSAEHRDHRALIVFKTMLGQRETAVADLRRITKGYPDDALRLAHRLNIKESEIM